MSFGLDPANETYTQIKDTVHDSGILEGLGKLGITLPTSFRAGKGYVDLAGVATDTKVAVIDEETGQPLKFDAKEQFLALRVGLEGAAIGGSALSVTLGLASTSTGTIQEALTSALGDLDTVGGGLTPAARGGVVGTYPYLVALVQNSGAYLSGKVDVSFMTL